jgi:hypothetical protein
MDKTEYVARVPLYYVLAIAVLLKQEAGPMTEYKLRAKFPREEDGSPEPGSLLSRYLLWDRAVQWLAARNLLTIKYDPFGPPIYFKSKDFDEQFDELTVDESLPFASYHAAGRTDDWLVPALYGVDNAYENLGITAEDFEQPDREWAPLQVERGDPVVEKAIESLQRVIEEVRADNGYAANHPQERDYVLHGLQGTLDKFESLSISGAYIRIALERLQTLNYRFAGTVRAGAIGAASAALMEFAKAKFGDMLNYVWKFFTTL